MLSFWYQSFAAFALYLYFLHGLQKLFDLIAVLKHGMCFLPSSHSVYCVCFSTDDSFIRPVTFWIVGDFDSPSGRQLLYDAIKHQASISYFSLCLFSWPTSQSFLFLKIATDFDNLALMFLVVDFACSYFKVSTSLEIFPISLLFHWLLSIITLMLIAG